MMENQELRQARAPIPIRRSLIRPHLLLGGERELVIFSGMVSVMLALTLAQGVSIFIAVIAGFSLWSAFLFVLIRMARADRVMSRLYLRHIKYREFYPAHGQFDAPLREYRSFK